MNLLLGQLPLVGELEVRRREGLEDPPLERKGEEVRLGEEGEVLLQLEEEEQLLPEVEEEEVPALRQTRSQ